MVLPHCLVCGKPALDGGGWAMTFNEAQATEVLGHAPDEQQSVVDPGKPRQRLWVGHDDCTGVYQRIPDRSAEELRHRLVRHRHKRRTTRRRAASPSSQFWRSHGLGNGQWVDCAACQRGLRVWLADPTDDVVIAVHTAFDGIALICGDCGRIHCVDCASAASPRLACRWCKRPGSVTQPVTP